MKEQTITLKNIESFELKDIFECGQCFRWNKQKDGSYKGIFGKNVANIKKENKEITIKGKFEKDIRKHSRRIL